MARRKRLQEKENHERWIVSYADFITLLFAFFVVMYSISSVNEGKYRVVSQSFSTAFRTPGAGAQMMQDSNAPSGTFQPIQLEMTQPLNLLPLYIPQRDAPPLRVEDNTDASQLSLAEAEVQVAAMHAEMGESLESFIDDELVSLRSNPLWLEIEINSNFLFTSASAELTPNAEEILQRVGDLLNSYPNRILVEGFTDDRPIQNSIYPSNWELSSARAASVIRLFESYGIDPFRMSSAGYGEFRPVSDNTSEEGRASNRRVVIVVLADVELPGGDSTLSISDLSLLRQGGG